MIYKFIITAKVEVEIEAHDDDEAYLTASEIDPDWYYPGNVKVIRQSPTDFGELNT